MKKILNINTIFIIVLLFITSLAYADSPAFIPKQYEPDYKQTSLIPLNASYTGSASYSLPIIVPPGRGGIAVPKLALTYNNGNKNGMIGVGWSFDIGSIKRSFKKNADYALESFELNGSEIVYVGTSGSTSYRIFKEKHEGSFSDIFYDRDNLQWIVVTSDGTKYYYGTSEASRQFYPENNDKIYQWCLDKVEDPNGNEMIITYEKEYNQIYPKEMRYSGDKNNVTFFYDSTIEEDDTIREDEIVSYEPQFKVVTSRLLTRISTNYKNISMGGSDESALDYALEYETSEVFNRSRLKSVQLKKGSTELQKPTSFTYHDGNAPTFSRFDEGGGLQETYVRVRDIDQVYHPNSMSLADLNGDENKDLILHAKYSSGDTIQPLLADGEGEYTYDINKLLTNLPGLSRLYLVDIDHDGDDDLLCLSVHGETIEIYKSNGDGSFEETAVTTISLNGMVLPTTKFTVSDTNGDGYADIVLCSQNGTTVFSKIFIASQDDPFQFDANDTKQLGNWGGDITINFADVNGDSFPDITLYEKVKYTMGEGEDKQEWDKLYLSVFRCDGNGSFYWGSDSLRTYFGESSSPTQPFFTDVNSDGISDLILIKTFRFEFHPDGRTNYISYLGHGDGRFGNSTKQDNLYNSSGTTGSTIEYVIDPVYEFSDVNGDGFQDLVVCKRDRDNDDKIFVHFSDGKGGFSEASDKELEIREDTGSDALLALGDVNGDGISDLIQYQKNLLEDYCPIYVTTSHDYQSTPVDYLTGIYDTKLYAGPIIGPELDGDETISTIKYERLFDPTIPFVMQVVDEIVLTVPSSSVKPGSPYEYTTTYDYLSPAYSWSEREFRGFAKKTKHNPDGITDEVKEYHQDDEKKGKVFNEKLVAGSTTLREVINTWKDYAAELEVPFPDAKWYYINLEKQKTIEDEKVYHETYVFDLDFAGKLVRSESSGKDPEDPVIIGEEPEETVTTEYNYGWYGSSPYYKLRKTEETVTGSETGLSKKIGYGYDSNGNLIGLREYYNSNEYYQTILDYDDYGNCNYIKDPEDNEITITYEEETYAFPNVISYPGSISVTYSDYEYSCGGPKTVIAKNGKTTRYTYDALGRYDSIESPDSGQTDYQYDDLVFPTTVTKETLTENGTSVAVEFYDDLSRLMKTTTSGTSGDITTENYFDSMGRQFFTYGPYDSLTNRPFQKTEFDNLGRPVKVTTNAGETQYAYEKFVTTITDPDGNDRVEIKDHLGLLRSVKLDEGGTTNYDYTAVGVLKEILDAGNNKTTFNTNLLGWKASVTDPDLGTSNYTYDSNGNVETQRDAKGRTITLTYDGLNRVLSKTWDDPDEDPVTYVYDLATNGKGELYSVTKGTVTTTFNAYDEMGRVANKTNSLNDKDYTFAYEYGIAGELTKITYPDGYFVDYTYHYGTSLVETVTGSDGTVFAENQTYTAFGQVENIKYGNEVKTTYDYNTGTTRLNDIFTVFGDSPNEDEYLYYSYSYTNAGDINSIHNLVSGKVYTYAYDGMHRLKSEMVDGDPDTTDYLSMDITYRYAEGPLHGVNSIAVNSSTASNIDYDDNGNMTTMPYIAAGNVIKSREIDYNCDNMPAEIRVDGATAASYQYDGDGKRIVKTEGDTSTHYVDNVYEVTGITTANPNGNPVKYIFAGNLRVARIDTNGTIYFHKDHLGSSSVVSHGTTGAPIETSGYLPYGIERNHTGTSTAKYKFTDQEIDRAAGLYNYDARLYDPVLGIFTTPDPYFSSNLVAHKHFSSIFESENSTYYDGGTFKEDDFALYFSNPQRLNRYSYVLNNPILYTDPSGLLELQGHRQGYTTRYEIGFTPLGDSFGKLAANQVGGPAVKIIKMIVFLFKNIVTPKTVGPNHPYTDIVDVAKLDNKLEKDYKILFGDDRHPQLRLTFDEASTYLEKVYGKYPEMQDLYKKPQEMLQEAKQNSEDTMWDKFLPRTGHIESY